MLNSFSIAQSQDIDALYLAFEWALEGVDDEAIFRTAKRYVRGEINRDNHRFAPTPAEFAGAARKTAEILPALQNYERTRDNREPQTLAELGGTVKVGNS